VCVFGNLSTAQASEMLPDGHRLLGSAEWEGAGCTLLELAALRHTLPMSYGPGPLDKESLTPEERKIARDMPPEALTLVM